MPQPFGYEQIAAAAPIIYAVFALWGLLDCFFGYALVRITLGLMCGLFGAWVGAQVGLQFFDGGLMPLLIGLGSGFMLGGVLAYFFLPVGVGILATLFSFMVILPIALLHFPELHLWVAAGASLALGVIAGFLTGPLLRFVTAFSGAFRAAVGVAFFFGGPDFLLLQSTDEGVHAYVQWDFPEWLWLMVLVLGCAGLAFQSRGKGPLVATSKSSN